MPGLPWIIAHRWRGSPSRSPLGEGLFLRSSRREAHTRAPYVTRATGDRGSSRATQLEPNIWGGRSETTALVGRSNLHVGSRFFSTTREIIVVGAFAERHFYALYEERHAQIYCQLINEFGFPTRSNNRDISKWSLSHISDARPRKHVWFLRA